MPPSNIEFRKSEASRIASYRDYIPDGWAADLLRAFPEGTVLARVVLDLALAWRCASYTAQMPANSTQSVHSGLVGYSNCSTKNAGIVEFGDKVLLKVAQDVPQITANPTLRQRLKTALVKTATLFRNAARDSRSEVPIEPIWQQFLEATAFRLSLWSSQRLAYVAFYNAYEVFLVDCLKVATGLRGLRVGKPVFLESLQKELGEDVTAPCWTCQEVDLPRLVRHAISHNGGRLTDQLRPKPHAIFLIGEEMHIYPQDIKRAVAGLRNAVERLVALAAKMAQFRAPWVKSSIADDMDD